jgi:hypothetical protein
MTPSTRTLALKLAHAIGAAVYLRARDERLEGRVTGLIVEPGAVVRYRVVFGDASESVHFDFELAEDFDP